MTTTTTTPSLPAGWRENPAVAVAVRDKLLAAKRARQGRQSWATPGELARALDPSTVQTPALDLIDKALVDVAEGRVKRLIISMPPQEGKSQRATHYGALWMLQRNPDLRCGIVSYAAPIATGFSYQIRNDIQSFTGIDGGPDLGLTLRTDSRSTRYWQLAGTKGSMIAVGIGSGLTSRPLDALIIDDPVKDYKAADSQMQSDAAYMWWQSVARPRLAPGSPVILILTRWSEKDLAGRLLAQQKADEEAGLDPDTFDQWTVLTIAAQADHDPEKGEVDILGRKPGEFMQSARGRSELDWRKTRAATSLRAWSALYQGKPSPGAGNVWLRTWWGRYHRRLWSIGPDGLRHLEDGFDECFTSWDMTFKDTRGSDYVVGQVWARRGAQAFLLDQVRERMSFTDTVAAFSALAAKWPDARFHLVEDKANGPAVIDTLRKDIPGIIAVDPGKDSKYARANAVAPYIEAGNVVLPDREAQIVTFNPDDLVEEGASFPNGANDDQVDATSQALARMFVDGAGAAAWLEWLQNLVAKQQGQTEPTAETDVDAPVADEAPVTELTDADRLREARNAVHRANQ